MNGDLRKRAEIAIKALPPSLQDDITEYWDSLATVRQRLAEQDAEIQRLRVEVDAYGDRGDFLVYRREWDELNERVRRLTEGLREIAERCESEMYADEESCVFASQKARALLADSPDGAKPEGGEA